MEFDVKEKWQDMLQRVYEYEGLDYGDRWLLFGWAQSYIKRLLSLFEGKSLEEVMEGEKVITPFGSCFHMSAKEKIEKKELRFERLKELIFSDLKLLYGVGKLKEKKLKDLGYKGIYELLDHPTFSSQAKRLIELVEEQRIKELLLWTNRFFPKSHPLTLFISSLRGIENLLFLDIESMGIFSRPIILLGLGRVKGEEILIEQFLVREIEDEPALLSSFLSKINPESVLVTFNGAPFDIPYIKERLYFYGLKDDFDLPNIDLLCYSRRFFREGLGNCRLKSIERYLFGIERKADIPSAFVPYFYEVHLKTKNIGPLIPIILHNREDIRSLFSILSYLYTMLGAW